MVVPDAVVEAIKIGSASKHSVEVEGLNIEVEVLEQGNVSIRPERTLLYREEFDAERELIQALDAELTRRYQRAHGNPPARIELRRFGPDRFKLWLTCRYGRRGREGGGWRADG